MDKTAIYAFGSFRLDPTRRRLERDNEPVPLTPKAMDVLLYLVRHRGREVGKQELLREVWPDVAVEENNLARNVCSLRRALGESTQAHEYVVTLPGRGYRFVASVREIEEDQPAAVRPPPTSATPSLRPFLSDAPLPLRKLVDLAAQAPLAPRVRLVGRAQEVDTLTTLLLQDGARLVTLTGPGGAGKTLLALKVVADLAERHPGGTYVVSLASSADPQLVLPRVAEAMGVRLLPGRSLFDSLVEQWGGRDHPQALLLLDNFEHVLEAADLVARVLDACPALKVVVTSQAVLRLRGEQEFPVPPLVTPDPSRLPPLPELGRYPAVALFVERASAARPDFALTAENVAAVAGICARLEGLPLAIELAATRIRTLPPAALLARLGSRLDLLTGGSRDAPARQQTLRGAIDWSHELLSVPEQLLFRRVSVFAGGCALDAIEAVCDTGRDLGVDVLDGVGSLVEKSLLQQTAPLGGEPRFAMLETIREYASERLAASGEEARTRRAHAAYCLVLAEDEEAEAGAGRPGWAERLTLDQDNLRTALDWVGETANVEWGLRLASALFRFWELREQLGEGRRRLATFLALPGTPTTKVRARALFALGVLAHGQGDYVVAREALEGSLESSRELGDARCAGAALNDLGVVVRDQGDLSGAGARFEQSARVWRDLGDGAALARTLSNLAGLARDQGDYVRARSLHDESQALMRAQGDRAGMAWSLNRQADVARRQGDLRGARALYEAGLLAFRELGDQWGVASSLDDLGSLARAESNLEGAKALYQEGLRTLQCLGFQRGMARLLEGLACCAIDEGRPARALKTAGTAAALRHALGTPLPPAEAAELQGALEAARRALPGAESGRAWREGWLLSPDEAIDYASGPGD